MKAKLSMVFLLASFMGSAALADVPMATLNEQGDLQALHRRCEPPTPQPTAVDPMGRNCDNGNGNGQNCPPGYDAVAKYCWGGWGNGWHRCGWACRSNGMYDGGGDGGNGGNGGGNGTAGGDY